MIIKNTLFTFIAIILLVFTASCGKNTNPLLLTGKRCKANYSPINPDLSEEESKDKNRAIVEDFEHLPDGQYSLEKSTLFVSELVDGEEHETLGFKAQLSDYITPFSDASTALKNNKNVTTIEDNLHLFKYDCVRNSKLTSPINMSLDGLKSFSIINGEASTNKTITYEITGGVGPKDRFRSRVFIGRPISGKPDDFFKGGNRTGHELSKSLFEVKQEKKGSAEESFLYEVRSEYKDENVLIRLSTFYKKN